MVQGTINNVNATQIPIRAPLQFSAGAHGWYTLKVPDSLIGAAQEMRARRDQKYGNIFQEEDTDLRWVGDLGEMCMFFWLAERIPGQGKWIRENAAGKADFLIRGKSVGMKTVKRKVPFRLDYTAQITAQHAEEPVDAFFFASFEVPQQRLWLLGGISRDQFLRDARYYAAGEQVHPNYTIREGHEIYNIEARKLIAPERWLLSL